MTVYVCVYVCVCYKIYTIIEIFGPDPICSPHTQLDNFSLPRFKDAVRALPITFWHFVKWDRKAKYVPSSITAIAQ
jgi:hypothetical protein